MVEHSIGDELHAIGRRDLNMENTENRLTLVKMVEITGLERIASVSFIDSD